MPAMGVRQVDIDSMKELIATGDQDLELARETYTMMTGEDPKIDDEKLIVALALQTDDDDDELVKLIDQIKVDGYEIVTDSAPVA